MIDVARLKEMIGDGIPCVPARPDETASIVRELIFRRVHLLAESHALSSAVAELVRAAEAAVLNWRGAGAGYTVLIENVASALSKLKEDKHG